MNSNYMKVGLFVPCCIDQIAPQSARRVLWMLEQLNYETFYPLELTCCGKELFHQGDRESAKLLGQKMIELYEECEYVVAVGSACVVYIQQHFPHLFHNTTFHNSYRIFIDKCYDISDFLINVAKKEVGDLSTKIAFPSYPHRVTMMDHCTTLRDYASPSHPQHKGLREEPRELLRLIDGLELVEMAQQEVCCGYGGLFASQFTPISDSLAKRKCDNAINAGAEVIASTEMGCLLHLQSYIDKYNLPLKFAMVSDILGGNLDS